MSLVRFESGAIIVVCISDTHNDDCTPHVPLGDMFIHAGDMTDYGSEEELQRAFDWISQLSHKVKVVVAGNHDLGLDSSHPNFSRKSLVLFTSPQAQAAGIHYLDQETRIVAEYQHPDKKSICPIRVYGNPKQPDFLNSKYAFTYKPYPHESAVKAWTTVPESSDSFNIWVMHSPPRHRLDAIDVPGLIGCVEQARVIAEARPSLCVFGHYHYSWGVERVKWEAANDGVKEAHVLTLNAEGKHEFDFSGDGTLGALSPGTETLFVNAAWMTMKKTNVTDRNPPFVLKLSLPEQGQVPSQ